MNAASEPAKPRAPDFEAIRREAFAAGQARARAECEAKSASVGEWMRAFEARFDAYLERLERHLNEQSLELAVRLAETLLRHSMPDHEMLRSVMAETLEPIASSGRVKVRMHPDDAAIFAGSEKLPPSLAGRIELAPDSSLGRGDMMMEDGFGLLDARLSERIALLRAYCF